MSWEQLAEILAENAAEVARSRSEPPVACPRDGEPLETGPNGELHCKFDGYQFPRDGYS